MHSAEKMAAALKDLTEAQTAEERDAAATRFTNAHLERVGAAPAPRGVFASVVVPSLLLLVLVVTLTLVLVFSVHASETAGEVRTIQAAEHLAARQDCERRNESRVSSVKNLRNDRRLLEAQVDFLRAVAAQEPGYDDYLTAAETALLGKRRAIHSYLAATAPVAVEPGSAEQDCEVVVPQR